MTERCKEGTGAHCGNGVLLDVLFPNALRYARLSDGTLSVLAVRPNRLR